MEVYISCHHPDPANELAGALETAGHPVVSAWHTSALPRPAANDGEAWGAAAWRNECEIRKAKALVLIASPAHISRERCVPGGKFVEAGIALAAGIDVYTLGGVENGMLWHPYVTHARDTAHLLELLS